MVPERDITPAARGVLTTSERGPESDVAHNMCQTGYITPAAWAVPTTSERGADSEVAHEWARWLHNPRRLGSPQRFRTGGTIRSGPQVDKVAT